MSEQMNHINRRDFLKGAIYAGLAASVGLPFEFSWADEKAANARVVLIRDKNVLGEDGKVDPAIIGDMLDKAVMNLFDTSTPADAWRKIIKPDDIVGVKSNEWGPLPTPPELEQAIKQRVLDAGVDKSKVSVDDRGIRYDDNFMKATALINVRPLRTHHWSGIGGCLKNFIMFTPRPSEYHDNSCADMALFWKLPVIAGKCRLNILVVLTPLFHGIGAHHFDKTYTWRYNGLLVSTDPVATDSVGLHLLEAKRLEHFGEYRPLTPPAHHVAYAEIRHKLGVSDLNKINLIKLGWDEGVLI